MYDNTKDLRVTQELLRHKDPSTTAIYVAVNYKVSTDAIRALDVGDYNGGPL